MNLNSEVEHTQPMAAASRRPRGRPRKVKVGDEAQEWLRPASAARLLDLPRSTMSDMMHGRAQVREPLVVRHLPNGQARISRSSVLAQLAGIVLALAVEQSSGAIVSPALPSPAGMGSETGKVLAVGARLGGLGWIGGDWGRFAGAVGDMPTGRASFYLVMTTAHAISPVISPFGSLDHPGFKEGGRGASAVGRVDGLIHSGTEKISALAAEPTAKAQLRAMEDDKLRCRECLMNVSRCGWAQCCEPECPRSWPIS